MNVTQESTFDNHHLGQFSKALDGQPDEWPHPLPPQSTVRFSFSGKGRDYLALWLTNWILTILTLGIYSAWAKVRRLQYVHQNTQLGGYAFAFHGQPKSILIGRIIGISLIVLSSLGDFMGTDASSVIALSGLFTIILTIAFPWFYRASLRFYNRNASYRNVRFKFVGTSAAIYKIYIVELLLWLPTLGLIYPHFAHRLRKYRIDNSRWGHNAFELKLQASAYYAVYSIAIVLTFFAVIALTAIIGEFAQLWSDELTQLFNADPKNIDDPDNPFNIVVGFIVLAGFYLVYRLLNVLTQDMIFKKVWNNTIIGNSHFTCDLSIGYLYGLRFFCLIATILTLGFFIPFAQMLITKRRIESISFTPAHDFDLAQANLDTDTTRSAEVASMFDIDIGW